MAIERFRGNAGLSLLGVSVAGFILIQLVSWIPLIGGAVAYILWPIVILALVLGFVLTILRLNKASKQLPQ